MLYYLSGSQLPSQKAHSIQQMRMCESFATTGEEVRFVHPTYGSIFEHQSWDEIRDYYGLRERFDIETIPSLKRSVPYLPQVGLLSMAVPMAAVVLARSLLSLTSGDDVIYSRNYYPSYIILELRRLLPKRTRPKVVIEHHDVISARLKSRFFNLVDGVVPITHALADYDRETYDVPTERIHVAPDGVDPTPYQNTSKVAARRELGLLVDEPLVVYTGHLYEGKGVEVLTAASQYIDGTVLVVGGYEEDISRVKAETPAEANVRFTGFVDPSLIHLYQLAADVLVAPYTNEARDYVSPLKLFEYMAAARPIVASDLSVLREVLTDGKNAVLAEAGDPRSLASAISELLSNPQFARRISDGARTSARRYTWRSRAEEILEFVRSTPLRQG